MSVHARPISIAPVKRERSGRSPAVPALLLVVLAALGLLAACGGQATSSGPGGGGTVDDTDCQRLAPIAPKAGVGTVALVMDNTRSVGTQHLPPGIVNALAQAQGHGDRLILVPVGGAGQTAQIARTVALDPYPGPPSPASDSARRIVLSCVDLWAHDVTMRPAADGSAILDALNEAARQQPERILVVSDGESNVDPLDLRILGYDPDPQQLTETLSSGNALDQTLKKKQIVWAGLGETNPALPQVARTDLASLWTEVLKVAGAAVTFDSRSGESWPAPAQLPSDDLIELPTTTTASRTCGTQVTVPGALLFVGDSATLQDGADDALRPMIDQLAANPEWTAEIVGNAAHYGPATGQKDISMRRARAVTDRLETLGIAPGRLHADGLGATNPLVDEFPGGVHDPAAAARNRRVDITMGRGCTS